MTKHLERVIFPTPFPFDALTSKRPSTRYPNSFDVSGLIVAAAEELAAKVPEQYEVFLLAVMADAPKEPAGVLSLRPCACRS